MAKRKGNHKLSYGRPCPPGSVAKQGASSLSSHNTRRIIRSHHTLSKKLDKARKDGDVKAEEWLQKEIEELGGLRVYQSASAQAQIPQRGGDTSTKLLEFLQPSLSLLKNKDSSRKPRLLDVGALICETSIAKTGFFDIESIDLRSNDNRIKKQNFMERPLPSQDLGKDQFDVISLSLVLNFVPDASQRGEMLKRACLFLRKTETPFDQPIKQKEACQTCSFPLLFLVLPAACITNSRYFSEARLDQIMESLGFTSFRKKFSPKLFYSLWQWDKSLRPVKRQFGKDLLNDGKSRNNFTIVLD